MDLSSVTPTLVQANLNRFNVRIVENVGLNERTGFWFLRFVFEHELEKEIEVRLTNFKYSDRSDWTLEVVKCNYLGIQSKEEMASFDMIDEFINSHELTRINNCSKSKEKLLNYLESNIVPLVTKKIKYTRFKPQFRFFLSHQSNKKPFMRTFQQGLEFLGYDTWLDEANMQMAAELKAALKISIEKSDCLIAWIDDAYMESDYCKAELLYAKKLGKIILPFGCYRDIKRHFRGDFEFMNNRFVHDPTKDSFFEILRRIDESLFSFESLPI